MSAGRASRIRFSLVMLLLVGLQFYVRPRLGSPHVAPDFLMLGLMIFAIRSRPGAAAFAGFLIGFASDALTPARFGAAMLANTLVGYAAAWGRAVFFADNLLVNAGFIAAGVWLRDLLVLMASGTGGRELVVQLGVWSPLMALSTAVTGIVVLTVFRDWLDIRLEE
jgi:rod shape-determining protein MreD